MAFTAFIVLQNAAEQSITARGMLRYEWSDPRLTWDPADMLNRTMTTVGTDEVWWPLLIMDA